MLHAKQVIKGLFPFLFGLLIFYFKNPSKSRSNLTFFVKNIYIHRVLLILKKKVQFDDVFTVEGELCRFIHITTKNNNK